MPVSARGLEQLILYDPGIKEIQNGHGKIVDLPAVRVSPSRYGYPMIIKAMLETVDTGATEETTVECQDHTSGFEQRRRTVPDGVRLLGVLTER